MPKVKYKDQVHELKKGEKLPDREDDIDIPYACYAGCCQTCACKVKEGEEHLNELTDEEKMMGAEGDKRLACQIEFDEDMPEDAVVEIEAGWED